MKFLISNTIRTNNFTDPDIQTKLMNLWKENAAFIQQANEKSKQSQRYTMITRVITKGIILFR